MLHTASSSKLSRSNTADQVRDDMPRAVDHAFPMVNSQFADIPPHFRFLWVRH